MRLLCAALLVLSASAAADDLKATITLIVVAENHACSPDGYASDDPICKENSSRTACAQLQADEVESWITESPAKVIQEVPPGAVDISTIEPSIEGYAEKCPVKKPCCDSSKRNAVVLMFEWNKPIWGTVRIRRISKAFNEYERESQLNGERRWINHQRADVFFPPYGVQWEITVEGHPPWVLSTKSE